MNTPTGQCFNQGAELTFWQFIKIIQTLGRPLSSSFKYSEPTPQPNLLFLSLPHVFLVLLLPYFYAYIILILATFYYPRYLYQYPLQGTLLILRRCQYLVPRKQQEGSLGVPLKKGSFFLSLYLVSPFFSGGVKVQGLQLSKTPREKRGRNAIQPDTSGLKELKNWLAVAPPFFLTGGHSQSQQKLGRRRRKKKEKPSILLFA